MMFFAPSWTTAATLADAAPVTGAATPGYSPIDSTYSAAQVASGIYMIEVPTATPVLSLKSGTYTAAQKVSITDSTAKATIFYTTNGATPTTKLSQYVAPIEISSSQTLKAIAVATGDSPSAVASAIYTITTTKYTIGGRVIGLRNAGTVQILDGSERESVSGNGAFKLPTAVATGTAFDVTIGTTPTDQACAVLNGSGTVKTANITNVLVYCTYIQSVATLNGSYDGAGFNINRDLDLLSIGIAFDGAGLEGDTATLIENMDGKITTVSDSSSSAGRYTVVTTDAIPVLTTGGNNIGAIAGQDADELFWVADASTADGGGLPALAVGVKPLKNGTMAELAGNWFVAGLEQAADPADFEGVLTFGADGSLSGSSTGLDLNGVVSTNSQSGPAGTITVTSNGQFSDGTSQIGYFSANREFLVATRTRSGEPTGLTVLVKQGAKVTLATLNGVYTVGSLAFDSATIGDGRVYTILFDGAGHWGATFIENDNGSISDGQTVSGTYALTSTGVLTMTQSNGSAHTGGVSADGNILLAANLTPGGAQEPRIFVGFRQ